MASRLLDQWGNPYPNGGGRGQLLDASRRGSRQRPDWETRMEGIGQAVPYLDWRTTVSASRRLWANFDVVKGATMHKALHAVGRAWSPKFEGGDGDPAAERWGEIARAWLEEEWFEICDVRGPVYDFKTGLFLDSISFDRDGDNGLLLTETADGYPQVQRVPCHRIGQHAYNACTVGPDDAVSVVFDIEGKAQLVRGLYRGMRIEQGVIFNEQGCAVAHRIIGQRGGLAQDISARDFDVRYDPEYTDQARGLPSISGSINFLVSSFVAHQYEQSALLMMGAIGLLETNDTGTKDPNDPANQDDDDEEAAVDSGARFSVETYEEGMIRYLRANSGNKVEPMPASQRPGEPWDNFQDRVIRIALLGIGWPYSLVWKPEGMNGTQERSAIAQARASIADRQDLLRPRAKRMCGFGVSKAMKIRRLPPYPGKDRGGFLKWGFHLPPRFSIDPGRDDQQWRENYKIGAETMSGYLAARTGNGDVEAHYRRRVREVITLQKVIAQEEEANPGFKVDKRDVQMLTPNEQPQEPDEDEDNKPPAKPAAPAAQPEEQP